MIGVKSVRKLLRRRRQLNLITHIYMLDSFVFCRRSYNHIDSENSPCLRCVNSEDFAIADQLGCEPWPKADDEAPSLISDLKEFVSTGAVHIYAQNSAQVELSRAHFGASAAIEKIGLWCSDWEAHFDNFAEHGILNHESGPYDIVYHGSRDLAKGLGWTLSLARKTPDLNYLIPLDRGTADFIGPPNTTIRPMRWEEGLFDAVKGARMTIAPSLWSAPCEGGLIKSILTSRLCAVVENPGAFSGEIPDNVVLKLPQDLDQARQTITQAFAKNWRPDEKARQKWVNTFKIYHQGIFERLIS